MRPCTNFRPTNDASIPVSAHIRLATDSTLNALALAENSLVSLAKLTNQKEVSMPFFLRLGCINTYRRCSVEYNSIQTLTLGLFASWLYEESLEAQLLSKYKQSSTITALQRYTMNNLNKLLS
ncbi:unnamed protein product, partial [Brenthis ino]